MALSPWLLLALASAAAGAELAPAVGDSVAFYSRSLHFTNRGIEFIYSRAQGGLERLTGMSAEDLGCMRARCHVRTCDACHAQQADGKLRYSVALARTEQACQRCHPVDADDPDVHFRRGMKCMDCHSHREIHGDGVAYDTYLAPGFFDAKCENCHSHISSIPSHTVHGQKLDCYACHALKNVTCFNCHVDTRLAEHKDVQVEREGLFFLVNHGGQVKLGNVLTYVYGNRTMITLARGFQHSVTRQGRRCEACHASANLRHVLKGDLELFGWADGGPRGAQGVVPVVEGMKWNVAYLGRSGERWVPLAEPARPLINFSGSCSPLSADQVEKLRRPQTGK
jgi:hypothetical protein